MFEAVENARQILEMADENIRLWEENTALKAELAKYHQRDRDHFDQSMAQIGTLITAFSQFCPSKSNGGELEETAFNE